MVFLKRVIAMAVLNCILISPSVSMAATSRPVGKEEKTIVNNEIYTENMTNPRALFAQAGGSVAKITEDGFPVIKFSPFETAAKGSFWIGPGYFRNPETEETLGLTNRNFKYAKLKMDIKLKDGGAADNLAINFGYVPISSGGVNVDFTYFGRHARHSEGIDRYVADTTAWQTVEIPVSIFKSTITNKYCIPGTDSWVYEVIDWSKFNLLGISIDAIAENREFCVRNITLSYPEFLGCEAEYKLVDEDGYTPDNVQTASGKKIYGNVVYKNHKTTDENMLVMLLKYKDDKMTEIKSYTFTADALSEGEWQTPEFIEVDKTDDTQIHMLVWDNKDEMHSAGAAKILR